MNSQRIQAWIVGFVSVLKNKGILTKQDEVNYRPYFFAMHFETPDTSMDYAKVHQYPERDFTRAKIIPSTR
ncbi:MAG: hypothetical protein IPN26_10730 [Bacteroidetes bacterium]|nr:hypothetical protein [Bacteroidota bacterium]